MGSILQFFDFHQASTSRKLFAQKRQNDGLEAPRNSLEFPMEGSQSHHVIHEDIPYSCQVKQHSSKMNLYTYGTPLKKLIDEEMSNGTKARRNAPSVVARLMGMDSLPSEVKPMVHAKESNDEKSGTNTSRKELNETNAIRHTSYGSSLSMKPTKQQIVSDNSNRETINNTRNSKPKKPQPREHPQEELLQKFKKEFETWQASKVWEHSRSLELDSCLQQRSESQIVAQEYLNREKLARCVDARRKPAHEKPTESMGYVVAPRLKVHTQKGGGLQHEECSIRQFHSNLKDDMTLRIQAKAKKFENLAIGKFDDKQDRPSSPTRIVILKPSSTDEIEDSWSSTSEILDRECSMKDFLEEVKERLRSEIQGKAESSNTTLVRTSKNSEPSFGQSSTDARQIARHIAKQIRESVTRDLGTTLIRSESTRSYRSEIQFNEPNSPEFINRDTRRLLSERLKNVLKNETYLDIPLTKNAGTSLKKEGLRSRPMPDFSKMGRKVNYWEERKVVTESKSQSFGHAQENSVEVDADSDAVSPRNLVRSFSAPVSGTAFGKLILEDQHVLTGGHIRRKYEVSGQNFPEVRKSKKDGFNLKGKVSNFRHTFTLKGKLFGKKNESLDNSASIEFNPMKALVTAPSVIMDLGTAQDNSTEVPPSPASVSSSSHDELCRPGHPSPVSPLEVPFIEEHQPLQYSEEFSSNLHELASISEQEENVGFEEIATEVVAVEGNSTEGAAIEENSYEDEIVRVDGHVESYVRNILVTAGLYGGEAFDQAFPRWDSLTKPISKWVFEEVEETFSKTGKVDNGGSLLIYGDTSIGHKLLFDLINEALPRVIGTPMTSSTFKKWVLGPTIWPHGKKLLDDLWHQIKIHSNPLVDETHYLDSMVAWDLRMTPWSSISHEDMDVMGIEMEVAILDYLIDEFVCDMFF